ncbi:hypothetical protein D9M68_585670 [compost metagenome]
MQAQQGAAAAGADLQHDPAQMARQRAGVRGAEQPAPDTASQPLPQGFRRPVPDRHARRGAVDIGVARARQIQRDQPRPRLGFDVAVLQPYRRLARRQFAGQALPLVVLGRLAQQGIDQQPAARLAACDGQLLQRFRQRDVRCEWAHVCPPSRYRSTAAAPDDAALCILSWHPSKSPAGKVAGNGALCGPIQLCTPAFNSTLPGACSWMPPPSTRR